MLSIDEVIKAEREINRLKRKAAKELRRTRQERQHSLRWVAKRVGVSAPALVNIEKGRSWETKTIRKIVKFYRRTQPKLAA